MQSEITNQNGICICSVSGDIDMYSAPALHKTYLDLASKAASQSPFILDLEKTSYLDSSGIGVLVQILADMKRRQAPFVLCNIHGMAEKLLHLSHMSSVLPIEKTLINAITRIRTTA